MGGKCGGTVSLNSKPSSTPGNWVGSLLGNHWKPILVPLSIEHELTIFDQGQAPAPRVEGFASLGDACLRLAEAGWGEWHELFRVQSLQLRSTQLIVVGWYSGSLGRLTEFIATNRKNQVGLGFMNDHEWSRILFKREGWRLGDLETTKTNYPRKWTGWDITPFLHSPHPNPSQSNHGLRHGVKRPRPGRLAELDAPKSVRKYFNYISTTYLRWSDDHCTYLQFWYIVWLCLIRFDCFLFVLKLLGFNYHTIACRQLPQALNDQGRFKMAAEVGNACPFPSSTLENPNTLITLGDILCIYLQILQQKSLDSVLRFHKVPVFFCTRNVAEVYKRAMSLPVSSWVFSGKALATFFWANTEVLPTKRFAEIQGFRAKTYRRLAENKKVPRRLALPILHCPHVPCTI